ncbi:GtrA family protein [Aquirufa sp. ROCK2-A2]
MTTSKLFNKKDLIAYFLIAGTGACVQLISGGLIKDWFKLPYESTIFPAYLIALVVGFILTKLFAFNARQSNQTHREMIKFLMVALFSGFVTYFFSVIPYKFIHSNYNDYFYQIPFSVKKINFTQLSTTICGMGFSFVSNFVLHKTFTFKKSGFYDRFKNLIE